MLCCWKIIVLIDKEIAPKTINDLKLIHAGKILENNRTVAESRVSVGEIPGGVITMHVVVRPPQLDKNNGIFLFSCLLIIILFICFQTSLLKSWFILQQFILINEFVNINDVLQFNLQVKPLLLTVIALIFSLVIAWIEYDASCADYVMKLLSHDIGTIF